jgi:hypothetical protein
MRRTTCCIPARVGQNTPCEVVKNSDGQNRKAMFIRGMGGLALCVPSRPCGRAASTPQATASRYLLVMDTSFAYSIAPFTSVS